MKRSVCLITGGSRGIGLATAKRFARRYNVVISARGADALAKAQAEVEALGATCASVAADVGAPEGARALVERAAEIGTIEILVNNAGAAPLCAIDETSDEDFRRAVAVNIGGVFYTTRAVWPVMKEHGGGTIVNVSSVASLDPFAGFSVYGACKAWVNLFTKAAAAEGKPFGIRVHAVAPGAVETGLLREHFPDFPSDQTLDPDDVAAAIEALCDERMRHGSGEVAIIRK